MSPAPPCPPRVWSHNPCHFAEARSQDLAGHPASVGWSLGAAGVPWVPAQGVPGGWASSAMMRAGGWVHGYEGARSILSHGTPLGCPPSSCCVLSVPPLLASGGQPCTPPPQRPPTSPNLSLLTCQMGPRTPPSRAAVGRAVAVLEALAGAEMTTEPGPGAQDDGSRLLAAWQTRTRSGRTRLRKGPRDLRSARRPPEPSD